MITKDESVDTGNGKPQRIEISLQGYRNAISIGKDVIRLLGSPRHICLKINRDNDSLIIMPCAEKEVLSFKVPDKLFNNRHCVFRVYSKQFVHTVMECNGMKHELTYTIPGYYSEKQNVAYFDLKGNRPFDPHRPLRAQ